MSRLRSFLNAEGYPPFLAMMLVILLGIIPASALPFRNLNFEDAVIQPAPANYTPGDAYLPIDAASALPFWTVREDITVCTAVWEDALALDETSVGLVRSGSYNNSPIQGSFSVQLYAYADAPPGYFHTASISQVGFVPLGTQSIEFLDRIPPVAQGPPPGFGPASAPTVTLNGIPIDMFEQSASGGVFTMVGDVSAFAGSSATLTIQSIGTSGLSGTESENVFELDDISFSPNAVPEPTSFEVLLLGVSICLLHARMQFRKSDRI